MELVVKCQDVLVYNISTDLSITEKYKNVVVSKAVAINHFDEPALGILHKNDNLRIYSMSGESKSVLSLKPNTTCFSFFKSETIVAGDSSGNIQLYGLTKNDSKPTLVSTQAKNDSIKSMNVSPGHMLIYCQHNSGKMSSYNVRKNKSRFFKFEKKVTAFDASRWSYQVTLLGCNDGVVANYDCEKEQNINLWQYHKLGVNDLSFSLHNKLLALSIGEDRTAALLACDTSNIIKTFSLRNVPTSCAFNNDNFFAIGDTAGFVNVYDIRMTKLVKQFPTEGKVTFVGFNHTDKKAEHSEISLKSRIFRETQNFTDSLSGNSLFSVDENVGSNNVDSHSFDLSQISESYMIQPSVSTDCKRQKQVKFDDSVSCFSDEIKLRDASTSQCKVESSTNAEFINQNIVVPDSNVIRKIVSEELKKELTSFEYRMKNDLTFELIDQLTITEKNILKPLELLVQENQSLIEENEFLRQEILKYKYNL